MARALLPVAHRLRQRWRGWRKTPLHGCSVIVTDFEDRLLLLRHSYGAAVWSLPGGGLKPGEDPADAARRELAEEVNMRMDSLESLGMIEEEIAGCHHTAHLFHGISNDGPVPDQREILEAKFFPVHSLPEPLCKLTRKRLVIWNERR